MLLSFTAEFVEGVENGLDHLVHRPPRHPGAPVKLSTIRSPRHCQRNPSPGDRLQLYKGRYAPGERIRMAEVVCLTADMIEIYRWGLVLPASLADHSLECLAATDGFESWEAMRSWFSKRATLPFKGYRYTWGLIPTDEENR